MFYTLARFKDGQEELGEFTDYDKAKQFISGSYYGKIWLKSGRVLLEQSEVVKDYLLVKGVKNFNRIGNK